jgi:hypothetical protein
MAYAVKGNARQAKFAARLLAYSTQADTLTVSLAKVGLVSSRPCLLFDLTLLTCLAQTLAGRLDGANDAQLEAAMAALAELGRSAPDALEGQSQMVFAFILREFAKDDARLEGMTEDEVDEVTRQWVEDAELTSRARAKLAALKLCVNRSLSHSQTESAVEVVAPVLKMLLTILTKRGFFVDEADGCDPPRTLAFQDADADPRTRLALQRAATRPRSPPGEPIAPQARPVAQLWRPYQAKLPDPRRPGPGPVLLRPAELHQEAHRVPAYAPAPL